MKNTKFNLDGFDKYLRELDFSEATVIIYLTRLRRIFKDIGVQSESLGGLNVSRSQVESVVQAMPEGSRIQAVCAWRKFAEYADKSGFQLPTIGAPSRRSGGRSSADTLHPQASAIWELFRLHPTLDPMLVVALRWRHVAWNGPPTPRGASLAEVRDGQTVYAFRSPLGAFRSLWDWARGDQASADPDQPIITLEAGGQEPIEPRGLLAVVRAGRAGRVPRLIVELEARDLRPPPPPVSRGGP